MIEFTKKKRMKKHSDEVIGQLVNKHIRLQVYLRATPIMEVLTGIMIAGLYFTRKIN